QILLIHRNYKKEGEMFAIYSSGSSQDSLYAEMRRRPKLAPRRTRLAAILAAPMLFGAVSLATSGAALAQCTGPGAPTTTQTKCLTAVQIPGNPLQSYDISWVNPNRAEYYLADRSNAGIDVINTQNLTFKRTIPGFVGIVLNAAGTAVDNNHSGPDGVVSHATSLYPPDAATTLNALHLHP